MHYAEPTELRIPFLEGLFYSDVLDDGGHGGGGGGGGGGMCVCVHVFPVGFTYSTMWEGGGGLGSHVCYVTAAIGLQARNFSLIIFLIFTKRKITHTLGHCYEKKKKT